MAKRLLPSLLLVIIAFGAFSQSSGFISDNVTGNPYRPASRPDVVGSPLLFSDWMPGVIYLKDGHKADKFPLNFDLFNNEVLFQHQGNSLVVVDAVKEVVIFPYGANANVSYVFRNGFLPVEKNNESTFYQVLQDGTTTLLKLTKKIITEKAEYNQPVVKSFESSETYYVVKANKAPQKISKSKKALLEALADSSGKLASWIEKNGYKCKSDEELVAVVKAFNENQHLQ